MKMKECGCDHRSGCAIMVAFCFVAAVTLMVVTRVFFPDLCRVLFPQLM